MTGDEFDIRLASYLAGSATAEERRALETLCARDADAANAFAEAQAAWAATSAIDGDGQQAGVGHSESGHRFVDRVMDALRDGDAEGDGKKVRRGGREVGRTSVRRKKGSGDWMLRGRAPLRSGTLPLWHLTVSVVSALIVAGVAVVIAFSRGSLKGERSLSLVRTYTTTAGQQATVTLADGSRAQLGPMTTLAVTHHPTEHQMNVRVRGEALFTVTHRLNTSFQVLTANAVTRVLGTTFLVRHYPADRVTRVIVADGRVSVASARNKTAAILIPRTLGTVDDSGHVVVTPNIAVDDYTVWTTGQLVFQNTSIQEVMAELSRVYGVELRVADSSLAARHLTWRVLPAQQSLADVLELLGYMLDVHPVRTGRSITFVPGRSVMHRPPDSLFPFTSERQYGK